MSHDEPGAVPELGHPAIWTSVCLLVSAVGGAVGWTLFFVRLWLLGLVVGLLLVVVLAGTVCRARPSQRPLPTILMSLACSLLTWPPLFFVAAEIWHGTTERTFGR